MYRHHTIESPSRPGSNKVWNIVIWESETDNDPPGTWKRHHVFVVEIPTKLIAERVAMQLNLTYSLGRRHAGEELAPYLKEIR